MKFFLVLCSHLLTLFNFPILIDLKKNQNVGRYEESSLRLTIKIYFHSLHQSLKRAFNLITLIEIIYIYSKQKLTGTKIFNVFEVSFTIYRNSN